MEALGRASVSKEKREKRVLEIGNELIQHSPSTKEELMKKLDAMGLFSNSKESNFHKSSEEQHKKNSPSQEEELGSVSITKKSKFPKTSKKQLKRKNSVSQEEELGSVSITKKSKFPKTSKKQPKRKNSLSQEEALGSVLVTKQRNFPKTSKEKPKRKNSPAQEVDSVDKAVEEHGEELIGCRVRVWWPLDQVFYEGHITSFDHSGKKHKVIYEDGDEEMLNLTKEHWELVEEEDNASDPIQEIVPGPSDLSDTITSSDVQSFDDMSLPLIFLKRKSQRREGSHQDI